MKLKLLVCLLAAACMVSGWAADVKTGGIEAGPLPGRDWISPVTGMQFVWIEALQLWVGKYEVTNGEYRKKKPYHESKADAGHCLNGERQPAVYVSFYDAREYADWMTNRDRVEEDLSQKYHYRLPTGEEWMIFAQCGDDREFPWGNNWPPKSGEAGNYHGEEGAGGWGRINGYNDGFPVTAPVDELWRNRWGLYGVGGNVWECTSKTPDGEFEAWRGASWDYETKGYLRSSAKYGSHPDFRNSGFGFRLLLAEIKD